MKYIYLNVKKFDLIMVWVLEKVETSVSCSKSLCKYVFKIKVSDYSFTDINNILTAMSRHDKVGQNFYCSLQAMAIPWGQWRRGDPFCVNTKSFSELHINYTNSAFQKREWIFHCKPDDILEMSFDMSLSFKSKFLLLLMAGRNSCPCHLVLSYQLHLPDS